MVNLSVVFGRILKQAGTIGKSMAAVIPPMADIVLCVTEQPSMSRQGSLTSRYGELCVQHHSAPLDVMVSIVDDLDLAGDSYLVATEFLVSWLTSGLRSTENYESVLHLSTANNFRRP